jgi:hypothetical protein
MEESHTMTAQTISTSTLLDLVTGATAHEVARTVVAMTEDRDDVIAEHMLTIPGVLAYDAATGDRIAAAVEPSAVVPDGFELVLTATTPADDGTHTEVYAERVLIFDAGRRTPWTPRFVDVFSEWMGEPGEG